MASSMLYVKESLGPDEELIHVGEFHWFYTLNAVLSIFWGIISCIVVLMVAPEHESEALMVVAHGGTFYALMNLYRWHYDGHIHNCQLHLFTPKDDHAAFPWEVCRFEPNESQMKRGIAEFCPRVIL